MRMSYSQFLAAVDTTDGAFVSFVEYADTDTIIIITFPTLAAYRVSLNC